MKAKTKKFDCVAMKRRGAAVVRAEIAGMSVAEQLAYWNEGEERLRALQAELRKKSPVAKPGE